MEPAADPVWTSDVPALATAMEELSPAERDRRIALAGEKIVDLRMPLLREQRINAAKRSLGIA